MMKQLLLVCAGVLFGIYVLSSGVAAVQGVDPIHFESQLNGEPIVLFSTHSCGYCKKARRLLNEEGVAFQELYIDESEQAYKHFKALGGRGVPLILIQDEVITGYDPQAINSALAQLRG